MDDIKNNKIIDDLKNIGQSDDSDIDLAVTALLISSISHPNISLQRYETHLKKMSDATAEHFTSLKNAGEEDKVETRLACLKEVIVYQNGYQGDTKQEEDIQNSDMMRVIDRRKGLSISLAVIYIHIARTMGWKLMA